MRATHGALGTGLLLRIHPTRATKDGTFPTALVNKGPIRRVTGSDAAPFEATYVLIELGIHAAEYGECEWTPWVVASAKLAAPPRPPKKAKGAARGK